MTDATRARVLVLGATGMLGHTVMEQFVGQKQLDVHGTVRGAPQRSHFTAQAWSRLVLDVDVLDAARLRRVVDQVRPDVVINCVGVIKQSHECADHARTVELNGVLPHRLAASTTGLGIRLIHVSTDCVFSGTRGSYSEDDVPDPVDFYGRSKLVGEPTGQDVLTLRTSIIGHELDSTLSLVDWFLSRTGTVNGFTRAIYSGVTTAEFARLLGAVLLDWPALQGLYHVASDPITKFDLLTLVKNRYAWPGELVRSPEFVCDRSMVARRLHDATGYAPPSWPEMISGMHASRRRTPAG